MATIARCSTPFSASALESTRPPTCSAPPGTTSASSTSTTAGVFDDYDDAAAFAVEAWREGCH
jgi:hypothetical protein